MRKLTFIIAAIGALAVTAPAVAAPKPGAAVQTERSQAAQPDEFSAHRRHWHHRHHWRHHYGWHRHHHWHRCRTVWRPYHGYVRVCRW